MADVKWAYQINQWKPLRERMLRREQQERAFKEMSACGFKAVELMAGQGRWEPLGDPAQTVLNWGSVHNFIDFLHSCAIEQVAGFLMNPLDESTDLGRFASKPADHDAILEAARPYAAFLRDVGGSYLVVKPMQAYWKEAPVTGDKIKVAGECWNKIGKMAKEYGLFTAMHVDCLSALHSMDDIKKMLEATDPDYVGLSIDTAELTIAGIDPLKVYEEHYSRVRHFHFKDAHATDKFGEYKNKNADLQLLVDGGKQGVDRWFWEMGLPGGLVDFPSLMKSVRQHNYAGWIVVECEQTLDSAAESTMLNRWYINNVLLKA